MGTLTLYKTMYFGGNINVDVLDTNGHDLHLCNGAQLSPNTEVIGGGQVIVHDHAE